MLKYISLGMALLLKPVFAQAQDFVIPVAISNLVQNPANLFDLQGKTVRFTPTRNGLYRVKTLNVCEPVACDQKPGDAQGPWYGKWWSVSLPFAFPFGGSSWQRIYVNMNGNITFEKPESDYLGERDSWPDGTMSSVAAAIDSRSAAGMEKIITVFWGPFMGRNTDSVSIHTQKDYVAITWNMTRAPWGQAVLGLNTFQARLYSSGVIEFIYPHISEHDGIVGLFPGKTPGYGRLLSHWSYDGKAPNPGVDIESADICDVGTVLDLAITMKHAVPTNVDSGPLDYRCWINHDGAEDLVAVSVSDHQEMACWLGPNPLTGGWKISDRRVDMFVSKVLLAGCKQCSPTWDVTWWGHLGRATGSGWDLRPFGLSNVPPATVKFSNLDRLRYAGNIFEVFHYSVVNRSSERLLTSLYKQLPAMDDLAIVFTDFRMDDLYGQGPGSGVANVGIEGIGKGMEKPRSTAAIGSTNLQMSMATVWLGAPMFDETGTEDDGTHWFGFARGTSWIAHEFTHRWGLDMSFQNPLTGKEEKLTNDRGHWRDGLDTTVMFPVGDMFIDRQIVGGSVMEGHSWKQNPDGTFSQSLFPFRVAAGYSPLDLYVMGMLPADKVPQTFLLENLKELGWNKFQGERVPVKMVDILKVMGPRRPSSADAQKVFHMTFYLAHPQGREADPEMLARAKKLSAIVAKYFLKATGDIMKIIPSGS